MKKLLIVIIVLVVVSAAIGALIWFGLQPGRSLSAGEDGEQTTRLERWVGDRLRAIADSNLNPDFTFASLDYEYPATVTLHDVRMTSGDTEIMNVLSVVVVFTEVPKIGKPIVIEKVSVTDPKFRFVADADSNLLGWSRLVRTRSTASRQPREEGGLSTRPSDVFAIRLIEVDNGVVTYELPDEPAMKLDGLTFELTTDPDADAPGWYGLDATLDRSALFLLDANGRFNIDEALLELASLSLNMDIEPQRYAVLPPTLQKLAQRHAVTGTLELNADGTVHATDPLASQLNVVASLTDGYMSVKDYTVPVKSMDIDATLSEAVLDLKWLVADAFGGTATITGQAMLDETKSATAHAEVDGLRLERFFEPADAEQAPEPEQNAPTGTIGDDQQTPLQKAAERTDKPAAKQKPQYVGNIDLNLDATLALDNTPQSLDGSGALEVTNGRLVNIPLFGGLVRTVAGAINPSGGADDKLNADLKLTGTQVQITNMKLISQAVAARGEGEINYDGTINFRFNAGPMEKVQESLGAIGELLGKITDKLVTYQVTGTFADPKFNTRALGIGATSSKQPEPEPEKPSEDAPEDAPEKAPEAAPETKPEATPDAAAKTDPQPPPDGSDQPDG